MGEQNGFTLFSCGSQWEVAYSRALEFCESGQGVLLLGPKIGFSGQTWLQENQKKQLLLGNRILPWREFVKNRARVVRLSEGKGFRTFQQASLRAFAKDFLQTLESSGAFTHIAGIWREDRFFEGFLRCLEEARLAGFTNSETLERAFDRLKKADDPIYREVYQDFQFSLLGYEAAIQSQEDTFDFPRMLQTALDWKESEQEIYCLGFDSFSVLEVDLLQSIAKRTRVYLPFSLDESRVKSLSDQKLEPKNLTEATFVALLNGFSGKWNWSYGENITGNSKSSGSNTYNPILFEAHTPRAELVTVARWTEEQLGANNPVRLIGKKGFVTELSSQLSFGPLETAKPLSSHALAQTFFHCLQIKTENFPIHSVVELSFFLQAATGKFTQIPKLAAELGIRRGLNQWKILEAKNPELREFVQILESVDRVFPARATASQFQESLVDFVKLLNLGTVAENSFRLSEDSDTHGVIAAFLRFAQMLAASVEAPLTLEDWIKELKLLVESSPLGEEKAYPGLEFYQYGEWIPPAGAKQKTLALGFLPEVVSSRSFQFYLEEGARRRLAEFLFPSQLWDEDQFLDYCQKLLGLGTQFSRPKLDSTGKELSPNSAVPLLGFSVKMWPEANLENVLEVTPAKDEVRIELGQEKKLSASFLEQYKECPFKAFALKILRFEDSAKTPTLDITPLDLGSLFHKILELFYGKYEGKSGGLEKLEENLEAAILEAAKNSSPRFFKGGEFLWNAQLRRVKEQLQEFLRSDLEYYALFPAFQRAEFEKKLSGKIGSVTWTGKVDRIDYDPEQKRFLVLDYKSSSSLPSTKRIEDLELFQIPLYVDALQKETGMESIGGLYVSIKTGKRNQGLVKKRFNKTKKSAESPSPTYFELHFKSGCLKEDEEYSELIQKSLQEMENLSGKIQSGDFSVRPIDESTCKNCEVRPACRIRSIESPEKVFSKKQVSLTAFTEQEVLPNILEKKDKRFNEEQQKALNTDNQLIFVEASAGTGKTTVIVEKIQRFLHRKISEGIPTTRAVEKFLAISFTEKSTEELSLRLTKSLTEMGSSSLAVLAQHQISTIHGFCKRVIAEFPLEAKVPPLAELMGEREKEILLEECIEIFFTEPKAERRALLEALFPHYDRSKVEKLLRILLEKRLLWKNEILEFRKRNLAQKEEAKLEDQILAIVLDLFEDFERLYSELKSKGQKMDFNDLESGALQALQNQNIADHYRKKLDLVLVDEFQDTNSVQREILEKLARESWSNFFVVGDAKQSIYRFRAADVSVFQGLRKEAENSGSLITLFRNYRSRKELVEASNTISSHIFPQAGEGASYEAFYSESEAGRDYGGACGKLEYEIEEKISAAERREKEARMVADEVKKRIESGVEPQEIAVLLRKISGNEAFLKAMGEKKIPFRVGSSKGFYSQPIVLDAIALLRALYFPFQAMAVFSLLRSPFICAEDQWIYEQVKDRSLDSLFPLVEARAPKLGEIQRKLPFHSLVQSLQLAFNLYPVTQRDAYQLEKLFSVLRALEEDGFPKLEIIERISSWAGWSKESDSDDDATMPEPSTKGAVSVMTVHSSKGLEFDVTILPDLVSGLSPDASIIRGIPGRGIELKLDDSENPIFEELKELDKKMEIAESKRLFYVAFTRAKEENIFVYPKSTGKLGERWADYLQISKFESKGNKIWEKKDLEKIEVYPELKMNRLELFPKFTTSISEIAANQFCPEFHRRKFVAKWDDLVVALLPKPVEYVKKPKGKSITPSKAALLLKKLKLENKERGIALHRVLERVGLDKEDRALWLRESYVNQGASAADPCLDQLIEEDLLVLENFLNSSAGKKFFHSEDEAFPELSFRWRWKDAALFGTIDRLVRRKNGEWMLVDYKSSLLEDSLERYRFQVQSYMCAIRTHALGLGENLPKITGYLVDLSNSNVVEVPFEPATALKNLESEIERVGKNYRLRGNVFDLHARGIKAEEHCFSCPYSLHCDLGTKFVLAFQ